MSRIAIVGLGGIFPNAPDLDAYWANVVSGVSAAAEVPAERWPLPPAAAFASEKGAPDRVYSTRACLISDFSFDPTGWAVAPEALVDLDPAFHLALHAGREAWRSAVTEGVDPARVGVVIGNLVLPSESTSAITEEILGATLTELALGRPTPGPTTAPLNRYTAGLPGGVLAAALGFGGGSYTLDAACASSLYALKLAVDELRSGRADAMLTGGVSRPDCMFTQMGFSQLRALSPTGVCSPFDGAGDGLVVGEGCGILVLKRLEDAIAAGDTIHGVIAGVGLSNDIDGSLLAPQSEGQLRAMRAAYAEAGWSPDSVGLIECHATGTQLGDGIEVDSLRALWGEGASGRAVIGSAKSNVGHMLTAAGAAGLAKVLLAMRHRTLPPTANFKAPGPSVKLAGSPFEVLATARDWPSDTPRRAAVSAFGFGGINAHVLVEEYVPVSNFPISVSSDSSGSSEISGFSVSLSNTPQQPLHSPSERTGPQQHEPIAIVGMAARFGGLDSLRAFQEAVLGGNVSAAHVPFTPEGRWWGVERDGWFRERGLSLFPGHYMRTLEVPQGRFRIPPRELEEMLPQQLLMLLTASEALADAGDAAVGRDRTGVFVGIALDLNTTNFHLRWTLEARARAWAADKGITLTDAELAEWVERVREACGPALSANRTVGALGGMVASRIAREFRIGGPSFTLSSEETSGIRALEAGARALQRGELDTALVGAVDMAGDVRAMIMTHMHRPWGDGAAFDASTGPAPGEGASAVVLKRLSDAIAAGDRIYAVLDGLGVATGADPAEAYARAATHALDEAGVTLDALGYLEAHASGAPAEDQAEAEALARLVGDRQSAPLAIGSVKPVIGHTGAASGLASVVKAALCLYQEMLPASRPAPALAALANKVHAPRRAQYWLRDRADGPRRAGVAVMGVDGNCAHVVLSACEAEGAQRADERAQPLGASAEALFVVEAADTASLGVALKGLEAFAAAERPDRPVEAIARAWFARQPLRPELARAVAIVAKSRDDLLAQIVTAAQSLKTHPERALGEIGTVFHSPAPLGTTGEVAFVFPGSGSHYAGMGQGLGAAFPEVLRTLDAENARLYSQMRPHQFGPWRLDWPAGWETAAEAALSADHMAVLFGQVTHGAANSDWVRTFGVEPAAVIGYSLGETAGFVATRTWARRDAMLDRMAVSPLFTRDLAGPCEAVRTTWGLGDGEAVDWALGVVDRAQGEVRRALEGRERVYLLIVNAPNECVVGGDRASVARLVAELGCAWVPLEGVTSVHCEVVTPVEDAYRALHAQATTPPAGVRFYSGHKGHSYPVDAESAAESVTAQAVHGVDFTRVIDQAYADGVRLFIELGPRNSCSRMIKAILGDRPHMARSVCLRGQEDTASLLRLLAHLVVERARVDLAPLYARPTRAVGLSDEQPPTGRTVSLPIGVPPLAVPAPPTPRRVAAEVRVPARATAPASPSPVALAPAPLPPSAPAAIAPMPTPMPTHTPAASDALIALTTAPLLPLVEAQSAMAAAHEAYLRLAQQQTDDMLALMAQQSELLAQLTTHPGATVPSLPSPAEPARIEEGARGRAASPSRQPLIVHPELFMDREACLEFARGLAGNVLGEAFAHADAYPTRVRLPDEPLMLVDRILTVEGTPNGMDTGRVVTEHDILPGAWYLDGGRIPTCIAVEAGQADLFLSGYLGIDAETRGLACYRLLDAIVTFHRGLPGVNEVIHYDIRILRFMRQGDTYLFFFEFDATVNGEPLLTMRKGCAGFFTPEQLADGKGIVFTTLDKQPVAGKRPADWRSLVPMARERYAEPQIEALRRGDLAGCFGPAFASLPLAAPITLPGGLMRLVDRVVDLDPTGGRYGLGLIRAEADIHPDDWFITCHFVDDQVMPGTLMYECCMHTLRILLMRMGWVGESATVHTEPVPGVQSTLKCRGQVLATTKVVTYEISIKELGYGPEPYAIADALMFSDGHPIVLITNMSVRFAGTDRPTLEALWAGQARALPATGPVYDVRPAIYGPETIQAYAVGKPSEAFGDRYMPFDTDRIIARLPGDPYKFLDRVVEVEGAPWVLAAGAACVAQYDIPADAWYFAANGQPTMPFAVLLEVALQPCGWLAAYCGSALTSDIDLKFRNLGGDAVQHVDVTPFTGTLTTRAVLTKVSQSAGMIIQEFSMLMTANGQVVYEGTTSFGFFTKAALSQQVGVRGAKLDAFPEAATAVALPLAGEGAMPMPIGDMLMLDTVAFAPTGGANGLGYVRGTRRVNPDEWFFKAHFYQDPVCPGSLGLESMLQLMKAAARDRWAASADAGDRFECMVLHDRHKWVYRGQYTPVNQLVTVEATIKRIDDASRTMVADGYLMVDGIIVYQMIDFALRVVSAS